MYDPPSETEAGSAAEQPAKKWLGLRRAKGASVLDRHDMISVVTVICEPETAIVRDKEHREFSLQLVRKGFMVLSMGILFVFERAELECLTSEHLIARDRGTNVSLDVSENQISALLMRHVGPCLGVVH